MVWLKSVLSLVSSMDQQEMHHVKQQKNKIIEHFIKGSRLFNVSNQV